MCLEDTQVLGGQVYNKWVKDPASYVYTLVNPHGIPPTKYNPKENSECIRDFGNIIFRLLILYIAENSNSNNKSCTLLSLVII